MGELLFYVEITIKLKPNFNGFSVLPSQQRQLENPLHVHFNYRSVNVPRLTQNTQHIPAMKASQLIDRSVSFGIYDKTELKLFYTHFIICTSFVNADTTIQAKVLFFCRSISLLSKHTVYIWLFLRIKKIEINQL